MANFPFFIGKPTKTPGAELPVGSVLHGCLYMFREADEVSCVSLLKENCGVFLRLGWSSGGCHLAGPGQE